LASLHLFRDAVRAKEIVTILLRYRFDEIIERIDTPASWLTKIAPPIKGSYTLWQRMRLAVEELGPIFVKVAQILSTRPDILPQELIEEFQRLRSDVTPEPTEAMQAIAEATLGTSVEELFQEFDWNPVASGSIGQIYRAKMLQTCKLVAIKIQRPGIRQDIQADLEILS
jgi:ubiquinone biosynthesis protein